MASLSESVIRSALEQQSLGRTLLMADIAELQRTERQKRDLLGDPKKLDDIVSTAASELSPMAKKVRDFTKYTTKSEAVDAAIPDDHPLKGMTQRLKMVYSAALGSKEFSGKSAGDILQQVMRNELLSTDPKTGRTALEGAYKYKRVKDAEFGEFGEAEAYTKPPGYDLWLKAVRESEDEDLASQSWFAGLDDYASAALFGAGFGAAISGIAGGGAAAVPGAATGATIGALLETVAHPVRRAMMGTEWYRSKIHSDQGWEKVKGYGGSIGIEVAAGLAAGGIASRSLRLALRKAAERGTITAESIERFRISGKAMDAVRVGQAFREEKLAEEALENALGKVSRSSVYDSAFATIDAATMPPGTQQARQSFADIVAQLRRKKIGELLATQEELAAKGVSATRLKDATQRAMYDLSRMRKRVRKIKGEATTAPIPKSPKEMLKELSEEGTVKALDDGAKTGDLNKAITETYEAEKVVERVVKDEALDYGKVLVGKKKAGTRIAATDKARVVLQRAGYTPEQISALDSKKVVRLAKKVRSERGAKRTSIDTVVKSEALGSAGKSKLVDVTEEVGIPGEELKQISDYTPTPLTSEEVIRATEEATGETLSNLQRLKLVHANMLIRRAAKQVEAIHTGKPDDALAKKMAGIGEELVPSSRLQVAEAPPSVGQGIAVREFSNVPTAEMASWDFVIEQMEAKFLKKYGRDYLDWFDYKTGVKDIKQMKGIPVEVFEKEWKRLNRKYGNFAKAGKKAREELIDWAQKSGYAGLDVGEDVIKLQSFFDGKNLPKVILAGAFSVPLLSLLSPKEAEAAGVDTIGKTIPRVVGALVKRATKKEAKGEMHRLLKQMDDLSLTSEPSLPGQKYLPRMQEQLGVDQMIVEDLESMAKAVVRKKGLPLSVDRWTDPATFDNLFYATGYGPAHQLATAQTAWGNNSLESLKVLSNILRDVPGYKPMGKAIAKEFEPFVERYGSVQAARTIEVRMSQLEKDIAGLYKQAEGKRVGPKTLESIDKSVNDAEAQMSVLARELDSLSPEVKSFTDDVTAKYKELAEMHPSVRISLAAEDTADFKYYPWLKSMMTYEEKVAVGHIKNMMEEYAVRHLELGHKVIEDRPFVHHAFHPKYRDKLAGEVLDKVGVDLSAAIPFTKLFKRSKYSFQMVPDINYNLARYIPDAERRIQMTRFWYGPTGKKSAKNTWYSHSRSDIVLNSDPLSSFWRRMEKAYTPFERTGWNVWANRYSAFETFMLIGFAPATAFKHIFKNEGTWGQLGFRNAVSHAPEAFTTAARNYISSPEVQNGFIMKGLRKIGLEPTVRKKFMDEYVRSFTHQFRMLSASMDLELATPSGFGVWDNLDRLLYKANEKGSVLIRAVESFDRAHSMHAALDMAARLSLGKKGMTAKQATYGIFDTILKNNFLGAGLNPQWMKNPVIRAIFLFQNTPFKILERRLVNASYAMKDVKTAAGIIKSQDIGKTLKELADMKNYILRGESLLKQNLIADAFTQSKDFFGTPYTKQFFREFIYGGMVVWGLGGIMDADFMPHTFHLPFLSTFGGDKPQLAVSPVTAAGYKILQGWMHPGDRAEQEEFWVTEFLHDWMGKKQAIPQTFFKVMRISEDDIPEVYKDSKLKYLFSVPAKH